MEELFENETKFSQKEYDIFLNVHKKEYEFSESAYMLYIIVFFILCIWLSFLGKKVLLGIGLCICFMIYLWYKIVRPALNVKKEKEKFKIEGTILNNYKFYKNYFRVESSGKQANILYLKIYRIVETKECYYIYISKENAFIISKDGFIKGNQTEFTKFLKKKVFYKYKIRMKSNQA